MSEPAVVKKYGNRRLYDTSISRYVTLEELAGRIAGGDRVRVVDAKSGRDLTAATLTQIIVEHRELSRLLPVSLLEQLIRLGEDALAEFFGTWVSGALEVYLQARDGVGAAARWNPFSPLSGLFSEMWSPPARRDEVAELRRELEELRREVKERGDDS
jgi:polyhydroxyalkanoate synthesis repressor PhaR